MKQALSIITKVLTILLVVFTVGMMVFTIFSVTTFDNNKRDVFGYGFYIVQSDSMKLNEDGSNADYKVHFNAGDIIITKRLSIEEAAQLKKDDVITFMSMNKDSQGKTITHMIREKLVDEKTGAVRYRTFGTSTGKNDSALVEPGFVLGIYSGKLPGVGNFFAFLKSTVGYIVCILVPFVLLIAYNGLNCVRLFRQYKKEQQAEIQAEKDELEAERRQNAEMLRQLQALQAQLNATAAAQQNAPPDSNASDTEKS